MNGRDVGSDRKEMRYDPWTPLGATVAGIILKLIEARAVCKDGCGRVV